MLKIHPFPLKTCNYFSHTHKRKAKNTRAWNKSLKKPQRSWRYEAAAHILLSPQQSIGSDPPNQKKPFPISDLQSASFHFRPKNVPAEQYSSRGKHGAWTPGLFSVFKTNDIDLSSWVRSKQFCWWRSSDIPKNTVIYSYHDYSDSASNHLLQSWGYKTAGFWTQGFNT